MALAYTIFIGGIAGFGLWFWLIARCTMARVATFVGCHKGRQLSMFKQQQLLFPRPNDIGVQQLLPAEEKFDAAKLDLQIESAPPFISWAATGRRRIEASELLAIRSSILKIASALGFPRGSTQAQRADFDAECSVFLLEGGTMPT